MKQWEIFEHIVGLLEKTLTPSASVQHNVRLPVLGSSRRRQCDLVIRYGEGARESIAIVEVQKRSRKPDINTFHGWYAKMKQVGAQHLYCVSATGYPRSVIEEVALNIGPTVRLLTLAELERTHELGMLFAEDCVLYKISDWEFTHAGPLILDGNVEKLLRMFSISNMEQFKLSTTEKCFLLGGQPEPRSLNSLMADELQTIDDYYTEKGSSDLKHVQFAFGGGKSELWFVYGDYRAKVVDLYIEVSIKNKFVKIPIQILSYKQETIDEKLGWVATAVGSFEGHEIMVNLVFLPDAHGYLRCKSVETSGRGGVWFLTFPSNKKAEHFIENLIEG